LHAHPLAGSSSAAGPTAENWRQLHEREHVNKKPTKTSGLLLADVGFGKLVFERRAEVLTFFERIPTTAMVIPLNPEGVGIGG